MLVLNFDMFMAGLLKARGEVRNSLRRGFRLDEGLRGSKAVLSDEAFHAAQQRIVKLVNIQIERDCIGLDMTSAAEQHTMPHGTDLNEIRLSLLDELDQSEVLFIIQALNLV